MALLNPFYYGGTASNATATEVRLKQIQLEQQFEKRVEAINQTKSMPELWTDQIIKSYQNSLTGAGFNTLPKRSKGSQLLRDAALGHKEYPEHTINPKTIQDILNDYTSIAADAFAYSVERRIMSSVIVGIGKKK